MANQISGVIIAIGEARYFDKKDGTKGYNQEITLDASRFDPNTGGKYENYPSVDISDRSASKNPALAIGMRIKFDFGIRGRFYNDKQTGQQKHINSVEAYSWEVIQTQPGMATQPNTAAAGQAQQMAQPATAAQQGWQQPNGIPFPPTEPPF